MNAQSYKCQTKHFYDEGNKQTCVF